MLMEKARPPRLQDWFLNPVLNAPASKLGLQIEAIIGRPMGEPPVSLTNGHAH